MVKRANICEDFSQHRFSSDLGAMEDELANERDQQVRPVKDPSQALEETAYPKYKLFVWTLHSVW